MISPLVEGGQPVALIIDDLNVCLSLGVSVQEVVDFLHYCQVLLQCSQQGSKVCVCVRACVRACVCMCVEVCLYACSCVHVMCECFHLLFDVYKHVTAMSGLPSNHDAC